MTFFLTLIAKNLMIKTLVLRSDDRYSGSPASFTILLPSPDILPEGEFTMNLKAACIPVANDMLEVRVNLGGGKNHLYDSMTKGPSKFLGLYNTTVGRCDTGRIICQSSGSLNMVSVEIYSSTSGALVSLTNEKVVIVLELENYYVE